MKEKIKKKKIKIKKNKERNVKKERNKEIIFYTRAIFCFYNVGIIQTYIVYCFVIYKLINGYIHMAILGYVDALKYNRWS